MIVPFGRVPIPVDGENAHGYFRRFAACRHQDGAKAFGRSIGMWNFGPTSETAKWEKLAAHAGLPVDRLLVMRRRDPEGDDGRDRLTMLGQPMLTTHVVLDRMRFCPLCLAEEKRPEQRILRDFWSVHAAPACAVHGTLLVDRCDDCGKPFEFHRNATIWSCTCGRRMDEVATSHAPPGAAAFSATLAEKLGRERATGASIGVAALELPDRLDRLPVSDLCSVVDRLRVLACTPAALDEPATSDRVKRHAGLVNQSSTIEEHATEIHSVQNTIERWPEGLDDVFTTIRDRNPNFDSNHRIKRLFGTRMGLLLFEPIRSIGGGQVDVLDLAFRDWLRREHGYRKGMRKAFPVAWRQRYAEQGLGEEPKTDDQASLALQVAEAHAKPPLLTPEQRQRRNLARRVESIRRDDPLLTRQASIKMLSRLWPAYALDLDGDDRVRKGWIVQRHLGVPLRRVGFHIRDAVEVLEGVYGSAI